VGGIYVHFPFCIKKCLYCDFVSYPVKTLETVTSFYLKAVVDEMGLKSDELIEVNPQTVYFGGGTPTCIKEDEMVFFIDAFKKELTRICGGYNICEFTVEANPGTVSKCYFEKLKSMGVNRLSMGVQSMDDNELKAIGRIHSQKDAKISFNNARAAGFDNINLDLMFGIPKQTMESLRYSIDNILDLKPEHISVYSLILEEGTPLFDEVENGRMSVLDEDTVADMYDMVVDELGKAGYERYEVSNFSLKGKECKHNLIYWDNSDYCGLGVAAHSHITSRGLRFWNLNDVNSYIEHINHGKIPIEEYEQRTFVEELKDAMIVGLRCSKGVNFGRLKSLYGIDPKNFFDQQLKKLCDLGLIELSSTECKLTDKGFILGNVVFREFV